MNPLQSGPAAAREALRFLLPGLVDFLADLHGAPPAIAVATVQLLPFGSRAALLATGLARICGGGFALTPLAFEVVAEAAARADRDEVRALGDSARSVAAVPAAAPLRARARTGRAWYPSIVDVQVAPASSI